MASLGARGARASAGDPGKQEQELEPRRASCLWAGALDPGKFSVPVMQRRHHFLHKGNYAICHGLCLFDGALNKIPLSTALGFLSVISQPFRGCPMIPSAPVISTYQQGTQLYVSCECICLCVFLCVHACTCVCLCMCTRVCIYVCLCMCARTCVYMYLCVCGYLLVFCPSFLPLPCYLS